VEKIPISREASGSLPIPRIGLSGAQSPSKLKFPKAASLPQSKKIAQAGTLTPVGKTVQATSSLAAKVYAAPRLVAHGAVIAVVAGVVLSGSTGHPTRLNPLANQSGYGSVLDQAAAVDVAAKVADQADLLVTQEVDSNAKTLNAQVSLPTSGDTALAPRQVVDTAGAAVRGVTSYTVKPGDTIGAIAGQFNITTDTVRWANSLNSDGDLRPGQNLTILPISGVQYKVQAGDTAQSLADRFQANAEQIVAFNNAEVSGLQPGQTVVVPDGVLPNAPRPAGAATAVAAVSESSSAAVRAGVGSRNNSYAYGYCTWYVATKRAVPEWWGNASSWYSNARISGFGVGSTPKVGAIAWSGAGYYGHVAYVENVSGNMVTVSEMNWNGGWNRVSSRTVPASSFRYIY